MDSESIASHPTWAPRRNVSLDLRRAAIPLGLRDQSIIYLLPREQVDRLEKDVITLRHKLFRRDRKEALDNTTCFKKNASPSRLVRDGASIPLPEYFGTRMVCSMYYKGCSIIKFRVQFENITTPINDLSDVSQDGNVRVLTPSPQ